MDTIRQITTAPETKDVSTLYQAFKTLPGNGSKSMQDFWLFITIPSPERDYFLNEKARSVPEFADNIVMDKYEGIC